MPWTKEWNEIDSIAKGGQGVVTKLARKSNPTEHAVLKRILEEWRNNEQAKSRMAKEIEILTKLNKRKVNVPRIYDSFLNHEKSEPFLVMEYIKGIRFDEWLKDNAPMTLEDAAEVTKCVTDIISICHDESIGHRDLKPANIILKGGDLKKPYVIDFGISFDSRQTIILTNEGEMFRNEFLWVPECQDLQGNHQDLRSDVIAMVGLLFSCVTGVFPVTPRDAFDHPPHRKEGSEPVAFPLVTNAMQKERLLWLFDRGFQYNLNNRFQNMNEFLKKLDECLDSSTSKLDVISEFKSFKQRVMKQDRSAQLTFLQKKYHPVNNAINAFLTESLAPLKKVGAVVSGAGIRLAQIGVNGSPSGEGDLLGTGQFIVHTVKYADYDKMLAGLIVPVAVDMQIHLYLTVYVCKGVAQPEKELIWTKTVVISEEATELSNEQLGLIAEAFNTQIAHRLSSLEQM